MKIYLLRHGNASGGYPDSERALSPEGRLEVRALAHHLKQCGSFQPKIVWHSPFRRAVETKDILLEALNLSDLIITCRTDITPEDNPLSLVDAFKAIEDDLLLVGHNPHLSFLSSYLLSGERSRVQINMATSAMLCLEWLPYSNWDEFGSCALNWMLNPKDLCPEVE
jgi:phosphohistidine phosphatase